MEYVYLLLFIRLLSLNSYIFFFMTVIVYTILIKFQTYKTVKQTFSVKTSFVIFILLFNKHYLGNYRNFNRSTLLLKLKYYQFRTTHKILSLQVCFPYNRETIFNIPFKILNIKYNRQSVAYILREVF